MKRNLRKVKHTEINFNSWNNLSNELNKLNKNLNRFKGQSQCLEALKNKVQNERERAVNEFISCRNEIELLKQNSEKLYKKFQDLKNNLLELREIAVTKSKEIKA